MRSVWIGSLASVVAAGGLHCSGDNCSGNNCLATGDGGSDVTVVDSGPDVVVPPGCDLGADITASPGCIDDGIGVFVDATSGADTNPGTRAQPVKTIAAALGIVGAKPRIYVCEGTYPEDVSLSQSSAVSLFGGLACGTWTYSGNLPVVGSSTLALHVAGAQKPLMISDLAFQSADATTPGGSSVAAFVTGSTDVTLRRIRLRAGAGHDGAPATTGSNWTSVAQSDPSIRGNSATGGTGGTTHACSLCADSVQSTGGQGGNGGLLTATGGSDGAPNLQGQAPSDGKGGASGCVAGHDGAGAGPGVAAMGATSFGKLSATSGWVASRGQDGPNGGPGQGGGGGGGTAGLNNSAGGGAGGGCGGCGGAGGKGGGGGGASVALAVMTSKVTVVAGDFGVGAPGKGASGSAGQDGQAGGYSGVASSPGCAGGNGGTGGKGGSGGGGAGGLAVGVIYTAQAPLLDSATTVTVPSAGGTKGTGGSAGQNDGLDGVAQPTLQVPAG